MCIISRTSLFKVLGSGGHRLRASRLVYNLLVGFSSNAVCDANKIIFNTKTMHHALVAHKGRNAKRSFSPAKLPNGF